MPVSSVGSATKILPKPSFSSSGQAPVYVMSATTASVSMITRTVPASKCTVGAFAYLTFISSFF